MDDLGRIVVPKDLRQILRWGFGTGFVMEIQDLAEKAVIVREVVSCCSLCGEGYERLTKVEKGHICWSCLEKAEHIRHGTLTLCGRGPTPQSP